MILDLNDLVFRCHKLILVYAAILQAAAPNILAELDSSAATASDIATPVITRQQPPTPLTPKPDPASSN